MKILTVLLLISFPVLASIDGTVLNKTTKRPQAGVSITLVKPGAGGMQTIGTVTSDQSGRFVFQNDKPGGGPQLLQANYKGVNYNKLMTPNIPTSGVELEIYEPTKSPAVAHVAQHMIIFEPSPTQFTVDETFLVDNDSTTTYQNSALGGVRFYLPPEANGRTQVSVQGSAGMRLPQSAKKTEQKDVYEVDYPVKPGETQFEIVYTLPAGTPLTFRGRVVDLKGMPSSPLRLIAPSGVLVSGSQIASLGQEPKTQATVYNVNATGDFSVDVTGLGSLSGSDEASSDSDSPQITEAKPPIYAHQGWLVTLAFSVLGVGLIMLFRTSPITK